MSDELNPTIPEGQEPGSADGGAAAGDTPEAAGGAGDGTTLESLQRQLVELQAKYSATEQSNQLLQTLVREKSQAVEKPTPEQKPKYLVELDENEINTVAQQGSVPYAKLILEKAAGRFEALVDEKINAVLNQRSQQDFVKEAQTAFVKDYPEFTKIKQSVFVGAAQEVMKQNPHFTMLGDKEQKRLVADELKSQGFGGVQPAQPKPKPEPDIPSQPPRQATPPKPGKEPTEEEISKSFMDGWKAFRGDIKR